MAAKTKEFIAPLAICAASVVCNTANTDYDDSPSANVKVLYTAPANGARLTRVGAVPRDTVADTQLQLYRSMDAGTNKRFFRSRKMLNYTMAVGTEAPTTDFGFDEQNPLYLAGGEVLYAAIAVSNAVVFHCEGGEYVAA